MAVTKRAIRRNQPIVKAVVIPLSVVVSQMRWASGASGTAEDDDPIQTFLLDGATVATDGDKGRSDRAPHNSNEFEKSTKCSRI